ncbi:acetyl-CoA carboxylase, biotin carboxyl carrier protein [Candidatus Aerophobetes bacterium]|uniref:Biotin carboxyl carrier protein of acetyl-CoA carboxylase n=1 Tax=Aerophobetes bacterium TaxID=2030807 RepID=A0A2A4X249_UNCAE|nr:MAG: acetyl-CoA carboxylase, biotin carboxyl carrier protein [Candidatus Aerophobetes bacterium]
MDKGDLVHLKIEDGNGLSVELEKRGRRGEMPIHYSHHGHHAPIPEQTEPVEKKEKGFVLTSPMVGMFYRATSPGDAPYIKEGDKVTADTIVCIIEAMKVMNEVKAGKSGTVVEVYAENGHPVEFGSKLIRIE